MQKKQQEKCDIHNCKIDDNEEVIRILSKEFRVNNKKVDIKSEVVLAERVLSDYVNKEFAINDMLYEIANRGVLTIEKLKKIKRPIEQGYTIEQVIEAMKSYIISISKKFVTNSFTMDEAQNAGKYGVVKAIESDRALSPFPFHCYNHIKTNIRRQGANSGLIAHSEKECNFHGNKGVLIEDNDGNKVFGSISSTEMVVSQDGFSLYEVVKDERQVQPLDNIIEKEKKQEIRKKLKYFIDNSDLSQQQLIILCLKFGIGGFIDNPYCSYSDPERYHKWDVSPWEHDNNEIIDIFGISRQRIGQQIKKCITKIKKLNDMENVY